VLVLAIDTALATGGVALASGGQVLASRILEPGRTHSVTLLPAVAELLAEAGAAVEDLQGLAVTRGPGYFTGLRIGLATALGLALARDIRVAAFSSLKLLAAGAPPSAGSLWALADARRGLLYAGQFAPGPDEPRLLGREAAITPERLAPRLQAPALLVGDGARLHREALSAPGLELAPPQYDRIDPGRLAVMGAARLVGGGGLEAGRLRASYLRPSDAEVRFGLPLDEYNLVS